jgi:hypothetical protein
VRVTIRALNRGADMPWGWVFVGCVGYIGLLAIGLKLLPQKWADAKSTSVVASTIVVPFFVSIAIALFWAVGWFAYWDSESDQRKVPAALAGLLS